MDGALRRLGQTSVVLAQLCGESYKWLFTRSLYQKILTVDVGKRGIRSRIDPGPIVCIALLLACQLHRQHTKV